MIKVAFYTLGCKVNQYDTQCMERLFNIEGWDILNFESVCDVYVINTCTVTATSDKKCRQIIARAHRQNPEGVIIVAGCYAKRDPKEILSLPGVKVALGTNRRADVVKFAKSALFDGQIIDATGEVEKEYEELLTTFEGRTRANLKIQDGCDRFCSYCIIPIVRGRVRSRKLENAVDEAKALVQNGFREIVLTGIHLGSYNDEGKNLTDAIEKIAKVDGIIRLRLGSLEPMLLDDRFLKTCNDNINVCRHFHISLQSGCDTVLKRMNRRYTASEYLKTVQNLRKYMPDAAITTDIIAGFGNETNQEHLQTMQFMQEVQFARVHIFPFSLRKGTAAEKFIQLDKATKMQRAKELINLGQKHEHQYINSQIGKTLQVLIEENTEQNCFGYTDTYIRVQANGNAPEGSIINVNLKNRVEQTAHGLQL